MGRKFIVEVEEIESEEYCKGCMFEDAGSCPDGCNDKEKTIFVICGLEEEI